jgi:hypothetical protein
LGGGGREGKGRGFWHFYNFVPMCSPSCSHMAPHKYPISLAQNPWKSFIKRMIKCFHIPIIVLGCKQHELHFIHQLRWVTALDCMQHKLHFIQKLKWVKIDIKLLLSISKQLVNHLPIRHWIAKWKKKIKIDNKYNLHNCLKFAKFWHWKT